MTRGTYKRWRVYYSVLNWKTEKHSSYSGGTVTVFACDEQEASREALRLRPRASHVLSVSPVDDQIIMRKEYRNFRYSVGLYKRPEGDFNPYGDE